jgi:phosphoenolpyruvate carboxykinase (ATP)
MVKVIPDVNELTIDNFREVFRRIMQVKRDAGLIPYLDNPTDLYERAKLYATRYRNDSLGWASNIWSRSPKNAVVINSDDELMYEHKLLMLRVLEHILAQGPLIKVDAYVGKPGSGAEMYTRVYVDPQFPDLAFRWKQLYFEAPPDGEPDTEIFVVPHYLGNPDIPGTNQMLMILRFPNAGYTIITVSSYQGEIKKGGLTHWIYHVYRRGGTGEHASLREFSVKMVDGGWRRIVAAIWGLTGSGKSTHGLYVWTERNSKIYIENFGINPLDYVKDQTIKNDDIIAIFYDKVVGSERGCWTKTEDLDEDQEAMWRAVLSSKALHENTEFDSNGNPSFKGELYQYFGSFNRNARSVIYLDDTGYFDGDVESSGPLNTLIFLSPGYFTDYAWVKITDPAFAAKVLADGRTIGHPAQSKEVIAKVRYVARYANPFTMGVSNTDHIVRLYGFLKKWLEEGRRIDIFQFNTTGRIVAEYEWMKEEFDGETIYIPRPKLVEEDGIPKAVGGTRPTIEETELFLLQALRDNVKYKPHPLWGDKVLIPVDVPGISRKRLVELMPTSYLSTKEFEDLLYAQIYESKYWLKKNCPGLPREIFTAMDI